jgi:hypothetical protein
LLIRVEKEGSGEAWVIFLWLRFDAPCIDLTRSGDADLAAHPPIRTVQSSVHFACAVRSASQNYDEHSRIYAPRVLRSKLIQHDGDDFKVFLRLRDKNIITVVLDTDYDVHYVRLDPARAYSNSYSTRVAEVERVGQQDEDEKPVGHDNGYLWRPNSYWRFWEHDGGVYVQLEAISLTRDIPEGLGWLIRPFITSIPRESLVFTLNHTRESVK